MCATALGVAALGQDGQKLIQASDCSSCHAQDRQVVGPAYSEIAKRYAGQADAANKLAAKIRDGGGGMTP
ncbi:MAG: Cytochrome biosis protein CcsA, partial [Bryobacterales bacterium]|nr:Cytochrome biosis protein CcsA [Bryobacterales bacterium]